MIILYLVVGVLTGLGVGWYWQVQAGNCRFNELADAYKDAYILLLSQIYASEGTAETIRCFLPEMMDAEIALAAGSLTERVAANGSEDSLEVRNLVALASRFGRARPDLLGYAASAAGSSNGRPEIVPTDGTQLATSIPDNVILTSPRFVVIREQSICKAGAGDHRLVVEVLDTKGKPVSACQVLLRWDGGEQIAYTGLKAVDKPGMADFDLFPGRGYLLSVGGCGNDAFSDEAYVSVEAAGCAEREKALWMVRFFEDASEAGQASH